MKVVGLLTLGVLAAGVYTAAEVVSHSPAFNTELRHETVYGDWRTGFTPNMYDQGAYLLQMGYGRVVADLTVSADTELAGELASPEVARQRAEEAVTFLQESLDLDPANAHTWGSLAWAAWMKGDEPLALKSLRASWELAPYNRTLAGSRLTLLADMTGPGAVFPIEMLDTDTDSARKDLAVMAARDPRQIDVILSINPDFAALLPQEPAPEDAG